MIGIVTIGLAATRRNEEVGEGLHEEHADGRYVPREAPAHGNADAVNHRIYDTALIQNNLDGAGNTDQNSDARQAARRRLLNSVAVSVRTHASDDVQ